MSTHSFDMTEKCNSLKSQKKSKQYKNIKIVLRLGYYNISQFLNQQTQNSLNLCFKEIDIIKITLYTQ